MAFSYHHSRQQARYLALQAIYQWQMTACLKSELREQFQAKTENNKVDQEYFVGLVFGVVDNQAMLDELISPYLDRKIKDLDMVELAILRIASYELLFSEDVPYKVAINEALELAKKFGSVDGYKYVNGVLDRIARQARGVN
jgi:transcription antitermination factor NusB